VGQDIEEKDEEQERLNRKRRRVGMSQWCKRWSAERRVSSQTM
jgi:hypothetical protein